MLVTKVSKISLFHDLTLVTEELTFCDSKKSGMTQSIYETYPILTLSWQAVII